LTESKESLLSERLFVLSQHLLPKLLITRVFGFFAGRRAGALTQWVIRRFIARYDVDMSKINGLCMTWQEVAELAADPLVTLGANTVNYPVLAKASGELVRSEMKQGRAVIEAAVGIRPEHLAYPYGERRDAGAREFHLAAELGYKTAVTTRPGMLFPEHRDHLTALPRIAIDGECQNLRHVRVLTSGAATAVWNGFADLAVG